MDKPDIILVLLNHYRHVYGVICGFEATDMTRIHAYLYATHTEAGVCYCSRAKFGIDLVYEDWVEKYNTSPFSIYWGKTPEKANTKPEVLERLNLRINILQKELYIK